MYQYIRAGVLYIGTITETSYFPLIIIIICINVYKVV